MNILYLTTQFPYPPTSGGQIRSMNILKGLRRMGDVTLLSLSLSTPEKDDANQHHLGSLCKKIKVISHKSSRYHLSKNESIPLAGRISDFVSMEPWDIQDSYSDEFLDALLSMGVENFDAIVIRYIYFLQYFLKSPILKKYLHRVVVDIDDLTFKRKARIAKECPWGYEKLRQMLDVLLLKRFYQSLKKVKACFVCSELDRSYVLKRDIAKNVHVVPNVIEIADEIPARSETSSEINFMYCGSMDYKPNEDSVLYFADEIFPAIKRKFGQAVFTIVGRNPREKVLKLADRDGIHVVGFAPSMKPYYEKATIVVAPILNAAGTRIKLLESMLMRRPIVSTSLGAEGLELVDGKHLLLADTAEEFIKKCISLIEDKSFAKQMTENAYHFVKSKYDISVVFEKIREILDEDPAIELSENTPVAREIPQALVKGQVSVVIPTTVRSEAFLRKSIESVLAQTFKSLELIVVDNTPEERAKKVAGEYSQRDKRLHYIAESKKGPAAARNRGVHQATGEYVAFLDDDDFWYPEKLEKQVKILEASPDAGFLTSCVDTVNEEHAVTGQKPSVAPDEANFMTLLERNYAVTSTVLVRKNLMDHVGGFDTALNIGEDYDLWLRLAANAHFIFQRELVGGYLVHPEQTTAGKREISCKSRIYLYEKQLRSNPSPERRQKITEMLAAQHYKLARHYQSQSENKLAREEILKAIRRDALTGGVVYQLQQQGRGSFVRVCIANLKPYINLFILSFKEVSALPALMKRAVRNLFCYAGFYTGFFNIYLRALASKRQSVILMYHRMAVPEKGLYGGVSQPRFQEQMRYVKSCFKICSLSELISNLRLPSAKQQTDLAITFDDGFEDFYTKAYPVLKTEKIPATVYLVSDAVEKQTLIWTEHVDEIFRHAKNPAIEFQMNGTRKILNLDSPEAKIKASRSVKNDLKMSSVSDRESAIQNLERVLHFSKHQAKPFTKMLNWNQILEMKANGVYFGAHTVSHPILSRITEDEAWQEISESKKRIEEKLGVPVQDFCYPNGEAGDFNEKVIQLVRKAGFRSATTTILGTNTPNADLFQLKRIYVRDEPLPFFAARLCGLIQ